MSLEQVADVIRSKKRFVVTTHMSPEGDALGSSLALALALRGQGKDAEALNIDPVPFFLKFLPTEGVFRRTDRIGEGTEAVFVVDCGDVTRTGLLERAGAHPLIVNIDHHVTNTKFGAVNWIRPEATATGEMIYDLLEHLRYPLTQEIATCLYTTLLTETGGFRYSNTTQRSLEVAAGLIGAGVDAGAVAQNLYMVNSFERLKLLGNVLLKMDRHPSGKFAWVTITRADFEATKTTAEDTEEFVNYPRSIRDVEVAVLFREIDAGSCKVSFRSKGKVDVARLALQFGGGGHSRAAGCTIPKGLAAAKEDVFSAVAGALDVA